MQDVLELGVVQRRRLAPPVRGGSGAKRSSARAPSWTIDHGTPRAAITSRTPATKRSQSAIIRSKASSVRTCSSVARAAASDSALPARVPPTPPDVDEVGVLERLDARAGHSADRP